MKKPFLTLAQAKEIASTHPTPFHIYEERGHPGKRPGTAGRLRLESGV